MGWEVRISEDPILLGRRRSGRRRVGATRSCGWTFTACPGLGREDTVCVDTTVEYALENAWTLSGYAGVFSAGNDGSGLGCAKHTWLCWTGTCIAVVVVEEDVGLDGWVDNLGNLTCAAMGVHLGWSCVVSCLGFVDE